MDEPTVMSQVDETDATAEKSDLNEVLNENFGAAEIEKPMDVDNVGAEVEPSTSAKPEVTPEVDEKMEEPVDQPGSPGLEDAGKVDVTMESVDQLSFDKDDSAVDQTMNDTAADTTEYVEESINISQLNVEHQDDSNDAFNAMKESETDALQESKDDIPEMKDEPEDDPQDPMDNDPSDPRDQLENLDSENPIATQVKPEEPQDDPEGSVKSPEGSVKSPEESVRSPEGSVKSPQGSPEGSVKSPQGSPEGSVKSPEGSTEIPETPTKSPAGSTGIPEPSTDIPDDTDPAPVTEGSEAGEATDPADTNETPQDDETTKDPDADTPMETDEAGAEDGSEGKNEDESGDGESREIATETSDFDNLMNDDEGLMGPPADVDRPAPEDVEDVPEDVTTETTTEGEGIDENVCLLGDETETETQVEDTAEDDEGDSSAHEKESAEQEDAAEVMEVDGEAEKEPAEPEVEIEEEPEVEEEPETVEDQAIPLKENEIREISGELTEEPCLNCENVTKCQYQLLEDTGEIKFLCTYNCVKEHREDNPDKYTLTQKKVTITERPPAEHPCSKCDETKSCKYNYKVTVTTIVQKDPPEPEEGSEEIPEPVTEAVQSIESRFICDEACLKEFIGENTEKYVVKEVKRRSGRAREPPKHLRIEEEQEVPKIIARSDEDVEAARLDRDSSFIRRCAQCFNVVNFGAKTAQWETFDFCNEKCLSAYQSLIGAACVHCNDVVPVAAIGKLCVRFGFDIKQFCTTNCLNDFKAHHQPCALCSKNLKKGGDEVVKKGNNKFCDEICAKRYSDLVNFKKRQPPYLCSVCNVKKTPKVQVILDGNVHRFCSMPCFSAFKFVNNVNPDQCDMCTKYFERKSNDAHTIYQGADPKIFCTRECMCFFITKTRSIWQCNWCKVSKYSFDMIQLNHGSRKMCSLNCLSLFEVSTNALTKKRTKCDHCKMQKQPQYHLSMSDASIRNFCTYQCVLGFQSVFSRMKAAGETPDVIPAGTAKRIMPASQQSAPKPTPAPRQPAPRQPAPKQPVISMVQSLSSGRRSRGPYNPTRRTGSPIPVPELTVQLERLSDLPSRVKLSSMGSRGGPSWTAIPTTPPPVRVENKTQVVTIPPLPKQVGNKSTMCKAITLNKAINCIPETAEAECQTEDWLEQRLVVPVPIPIYIPQPMYMYNMPTIVPVPIPLPIPVPVFVPTTRNSAGGIMKEIKKIQEKMPTDPYEAELLMMAEMVAGDKKREETDSDSDENNDMEYGDGMEHNSSFNEDLVQMAFKMASGNDFDDPPVDLENEMTANTISQSTNAYGDDMDPHSLQHHQLLLLQQQRDAAIAMQNRNRKRIQPPTKPSNNRNPTPNKRIKREMEVMQPEMPREPAEKPDANMCLKYTFGVNAWKQWVATKNADFEKSSIRRKPIKSEILQLTADELNYSLCMFVKEVRKPNGSEYAPDTIYYLVLGIQQYLYENGRIDNIFTDRYYEQFTDCLDEVAKKFSVLYNDSQYIVTRVEEEHLWECKQLGAHSPHVLLSTLMFFNTKHFNLVTVDEHMELSFSHIMKHWKRNPNQPGAAKVPGSRNVLLRFYPPQSSLEANSRKKKVYEQQENEENPLRCPVKLYEFYLSKCPESVKTRNDVFYLQPERSCVPDSPVWYSTQPLSRDALSKMLHRVKMVKEINIALLTS